MKPEISIIIPVYNVETYLRKCIESIIEQSFINIEIILVDDGSSDKSGEICDTYSLKDSRIKVVHKENEGLSCARNDGIQISTAPYIMFVDGDDWVGKDFCKAPLRVAKEYNADIVMFTYTSVYSDGRMSIEKPRMQEGQLNEREAMTFNVFFSCHAWGALYSKKLFSEVRFPAGKIQEDVGTTHKLLHLAKRIFFFNYPVYYYRVKRPGSITSTHSERSHPDVRLMLLEKIKDLCRWGYDDLAQKDALTLLVWYGCHTISEDSKHLINIFIDKPSISNLCIKQKIMIGILKLSPELFNSICIVMRKRKRAIKMQKGDDQF